jgi:cell division protein ZapA (FtsZ GTPase activity inhibitor)
VSGKKTVVRVTIGSDEYTLRSDRPTEYTRAVAEYLDGALRDVLSAGSIVETQKAAILAGLAVADELFQARQAQREMAHRLTSLTADLARLLPPAKRTSRPAGSIASPEPNP